uniref:Uncharacterized protein n=1 Tax=Palpitomonas bilix TaxID=652834 RepID=A0A7S3GBU9_9EUKA|mmetsp:Transcript_38670/g.99289  ORF Transcript_38670/g.99289 Transcript_38670/m.99289 type:complete len:106 (+) Transcript_38670:115-432(+)
MSLIALDSSLPSRVSRGSVSTSKPLKLNEGKIQHCAVYVARRCSMTRHGAEVELELPLCCSALCLPILLLCSFEVASCWRRYVEGAVCVVVIAQQHNLASSAYFV